MTDLPDLLNRIEGHEFSALVNVASDLKSFLRGVDARPEFQELLERLKDEAAAKEVRDRALRLIRSPVEPMYEHLYDVAVATYIVALGTWQEAFAIEVETAVARSPELGWWWADHVVKDIFVPKG